LTARRNALGANPGADVLDQIDSTLAPVNVHLSTLLPALSATVLGHGTIVFMLRATARR
jgi:hypothetical protein